MQIKENLTNHNDQLYRYFSTKIKLAILTNGIKYLFLVI